MNFISSVIDVFKTMSNALFNVCVRNSRALSAIPKPAQTIYQHTIQPGFVILFLVHCILLKPKMAAPTSNLRVNVFIVISSKCQFSIFPKTDQHKT